MNLAAPGALGGPRAERLIADDRPRGVHLAEQGAGHGHVEPRDLAVWPDARAADPAATVEPDVRVGVGGIIIHSRLLGAVRPGITALPRRPGRLCVHCQRTTPAHARPWVT